MGEACKRMNEQYMEQAAQLEAAERELAIKQASTHAFPDTLLTPDQYKTLVCLNCDDDMPEFRMQRGCLLCTICQDRKEKRR